LERDGQRGKTGRDRVDGDGTERRKEVAEREERMRRDMLVGIMWW